MLISQPLCESLCLSALVVHQPRVGANADQTRKGAERNSWTGEARLFSIHSSVVDRSTSSADQAHPFAIWCLGFGISLLH